MENPPFEDVFPIENGGFSNVMLVSRGVYLIHPQVAVSIHRNRTRTPGPPPLLAAASLRICLRMAWAAGLLLPDVFWLKKGWKVREDTRISPYLCIYIYIYIYIFSFMSFKFWSLHVCSEFCLIILVRSKPFLSAMAEAASVGRYLLVRWHVPNFGHAVKWRNLPWSQWKKS